MHDKESADEIRRYPPEIRVAASELRSLSNWNNIGLDLADDLGCPIQRDDLADDDDTGTRHLLRRYLFNYRGKRTN